jgi:hypothetical protein
MRSRIIIVLLSIILCLFNTVASAVPVNDIRTVVEAPGVGTLVLHQAQTQLSGDTPNVDWWYGCSPTAAGMWAGYHDRNGFPNLIPGGVAELDTFPSTAGLWEYAIQDAIASPEHASDFYGGGYNASGDDKSPWKHVYQGYNQGLHQWIELPIGGTNNITEIRTRGFNSDYENRPVYVWEVQAWDVQNQTWVSPTAHQDYGTWMAWTNEHMAHDGQVGTSAVAPTMTLRTWTEFLGLKYPSGVDTTKIRYYGRRWLDGDDVDFDVKIPAQGSRTLPNFNCLADYMGTSQDNLSSQFGGNSNGATSFFFQNDNSRFDAAEAQSLGHDYYNMSGMFGILEYIEARGYYAEAIFNQYIAGYGGASGGFTFDEYKSEIDSGNPVLIHVQGHSMIGYGYDPGTSTIHVYDTWSPNGQNPGTMSWGGTYPHSSGNLQHYGVTVIHPMVPEPSTIFILGLGVLFMRFDKRRKRV